MSQTLQNQITLAKSMNGIVTLSDGAGTTISNGTVTTDNLVTDTMTATNMVSNNMIVPRINTALIPSLGADINLTTLVQNMKWSTTAQRKISIYPDAPGVIGMFEVDVGNNIIYINTFIVSIFATNSIDISSPFLDLNIGTIDLLNSNITANGFTITPTEIGYLDGVTSNIQTQIGNILSQLSNYVTLTTTQTITGTKTMTNLLPVFSLNTSSYKMGTSAMGTQPAGSANNIAIGTNALRGNTTYGASVASSRNIVLGDNACQNFNLGTQDDNVVIGYGALRSAFVSCRENVMIGSNVAANQAVNYRNVYIGHNVVSGASTGENRDNVVIGANSCLNLGGRAQICVVGYGNGSASSSVGNSWTIVGSLNATNAIQGNRICIFGSENLQNINADVFSMAIGNNNGNFQTTGFFNLYFGFNNNIAANNLINSATIGIACTIPRSHCLYLGASTADNITYQNMCIAFKTTVLCCKSVTGVTYNLAFEDEEYIRISDNTTVTVNLPTPTATSGTTKNVGARWTLLRTQTTASTITINAPSGQTLRTPTGTTASSYTMKATEWYVTITCIFNSGVSYQISSSQQTQISNIANSYENITNQMVQLGTANVQNVGLHNTLVGYNAGIALTTGGNTTTAIGHLALSSVTNTILNTAIGAGAGRSQTLSRSTFIGGNAGGGSVSATKCVFLGENSAFSSTTGLLEECTLLGNKSDVAVATTNYRNSTALGAHAIISESNSIEMGGPDQITGEYPNVVVPNKVKLQNTILIGPSVSYNITYRTPETIIVDNSLTTTINLPTPNFNSIGMSFKIVRAYSTGLATNITIQATSGINIAGNGVIANTYVMNALETVVFVSLIATSGTASWSVSGKTLDPQQATEVVTMQDTANVTRYITFAYQSPNSTTFNSINTDTDLTYNSSTNVMTVPTITATTATVTNLTVANKVEIQKTVTIGAVASYTISLPCPEEIIVSSTTTTDIYLPTASVTASIGTSIKITRSYLVGTIGNVININTPTGETIQSFDSPPNVVLYMDYSISTIKCVISAQNVWVASYGRDFTQCLQVKNGAAAMQVTNATTGNVTVTMAAPYYEYYPFTNVINSLTYNLPVITAAMVGLKLVFKRFGGTYNAVNFNPSVPYPGVAIFGLGGTALGSTATQALISATQNTCTIVAIKTQDSFTGTFTNTAGATVVTIVTTNGTIFAGGYFSFNGNLRYITSCGTGRGGTGTYNIDTSITLANTAQAFTANVSYGWMVLHQG
jgi:hypothetical protein